MRRVTLVLCALSLLSMPVLGACGGEEPKPVMPSAPVEPPPAPTAVEPPAPPPAPQPSLADLQKAALGMALQGLNGHDPKMFASVYADDAIISVAGLNEVNGREAIAQNMAEWFEVFSKAKLGFSRVWVKGDVMVLEWVINGTHHGELFGVKSTEQPIGHYGLSIVQFNDEGKVQREDRYGELGAVMTQLNAAGGAKAKPRPIPDVPAAPETIMATGNEEKNLDVAKVVLTALETKKEADFTAALTDDVEQDGVFHLETSKGKDGAKKFFKSFTTAFPDAKFDVKKAFAIGDYAIVMSTMTATQKGALGQIAATKRPVAVHLVDIFKIKDGKVARAWTYQNSLEMQQQLGLFQVTAGNVPASQAVAATAKPGTAAPAMAPKPGGGGTGGGGGKDNGGGGGKGTGGGTGGGKK
jgi:steroid delta-isomerase-like uncharacterized protein